MDAAQDEGRDVVPEEAREPGTKYSRPMMGIMVVPKDGATGFGMLSTKDVQRMIDYGKFRNLPVMHEHNREWGKIGHVIDGRLIDGAAWASVRLDLDNRRACFVWNQVKKGNTPCFSLSHLHGRKEPTELSIVCVPVRHEAAIVRCSAKDGAAEYVGISGSAPAVHPEGAQAETKSDPQTFIAYSNWTLMSEGGANTGTPVGGAPAAASAATAPTHIPSIAGHPTNVNPVAQALHAPTNNNTPAPASASAAAAGGNKAAAAAAAGGVKHESDGPHAGSKRSFDDSSAPMNTDKTAEGSSAVNTPPPSPPRVERPSKASRGENNADVSGMLQKLQSKIEQLERSQAQAANETRKIAAQEYASRVAENVWQNEMKKMEDEYTEARANYPHGESSIAEAQARFQKALPLLSKLNESDRRVMMDEFRAGFKTLTSSGPQVPPPRRPAAAAAGEHMEDDVNGMPSRDALARAMNPAHRGYGYGVPAPSRAAAAAASFAGVPPGPAPASAAARGGGAGGRAPPPQVPSSNPDGSSGFKRGGGVSISDQPYVVPGTNGLTVVCPDFQISCSAGGGQSIRQMKPEERVELMATVAAVQDRSIMQVAFCKHADGVQNYIAGTNIVKQYEARMGNGFKLLDNGYVLSPGLA